MNSNACVHHAQAPSHPASATKVTSSGVIDAHMSGAKATSSGVIDAHLSGAKATSSGVIDAHMSGTKATSSGAIDAHLSGASTDESTRARVRAEQAGSQEKKLVKASDSGDHDYDRDDDAHKAVSKGAGIEDHKKATAHMSVVKATAHMSVVKATAHMSEVHSGSAVDSTKAANADTKAPSGTAVMAPHHLTSAGEQMPNTEQEEVEEADPEEPARPWKPDAGVIERPALKGDKMDHSVTNTPPEPALALAHDWTTEQPTQGYDASINPSRLRGLTEPARIDRSVIPLRGLTEGERQAYDVELENLRAELAMLRSRCAPSSWLTPTFIHPFILSFIDLLAFSIRKAMKLCMTASLSDVVHMPFSIHACTLVLYHARLQLFGAVGPCSPAC
jgi:hypothetical protein